jgi:hypothetical protein
VTFLEPALLAQQQAASPPHGAASIFVALAWLVGGAGVLVIAGLVVRRLLIGKPGDTGATAFSLSDLRRLRAAGQITDAEFDRARSALIAASRAAMNGDRPITPAEEPLDATPPDDGGEASDNGPREK